MIYAKSQNGVAVSGPGKTSLPQDKQIRIDLDLYANGDVCQLGISNTIACAMSEYRQAILFLEDLPVNQRISPEVARFAVQLREALAHIEKWRERRNGIRYSGGIPLGPSKIIG